MRKKKTRKIYAKLNPVFFAIEGAAFIDKDTLDTLRQGELMSIEAFRTGTAQPADWQRVCEICNLCESMAMAGIGPEALETVGRVQQELIDAEARYRRTGKMGATGPGLVAFRDVYEYHDLQRQSVSRSVYESHIMRVFNKIRSRSPDILFMNKKGAT